jgi:hypothetical protein
MLWADPQPTPGRGPSKVSHNWKYKQPFVVFIWVCDTDVNDDDDVVVVAWSWLFVWTWCNRAIFTRK